jgi:predicted phosphate transport protein (TIGR00153 family)
MFSNLMPQRREFYDLLTSHTDRLMAAANAVLRLVNALGTESSETGELIKEVGLYEQSADKIKADLIALLHKSFITPISRDDIHTLITELDKVLGALQDVANAVGMYHIKDSTPEAREMASLGADACQRLNRAVIALSDKDRRKDALTFCQEVDAIESKADKVFKKAITRLFQGEGDIWAAMKLKEFYFLLENVLDYCEEASKTIEGILIENA